MKRIWVGVDGGATKTRVILQTDEGKTLGSGQGGPANIRFSPQNAMSSIEEGFLRACQEASLNPDDATFYAGLGLAGTEIPSSTAEFLTLPHRFHTLALTSDAETACVGAHEGRDGGIIIIGTGVIAYAKVNHITHRVGGWGFPQGDEGSGAALGLEALRLVFHAIDGRTAWTPLLEDLFTQFDRNVKLLCDWVNTAQASEFATLVPRIIEHSQQQEPLSVELLKKAAGHIDEAGKALLKQSENSTLPISLLGSIAPFIAPYLSTDLKKQIVEAKQDAAVGAILWLKKYLQQLNTPSPASLSTTR